MRIFILTTNDRIFLPHFFEKVFANINHEVVGLAVVEDPNFKKFLINSLKFMGPWLFAGEIIHQLKVRSIDTLQALFAPSKRCSIKTVCEKHKIPVMMADKINSNGFRSFLRSLNIDVLISVACPQILKKKILEIPSRAAINVHYGLLPDYKGQYPSFWVLARGEEYTGVSVHHMVPRVDAGDILVQLKESILPDDTFYTLVKRLKTTIGPQAIIQALKKIENGDNSVIKNDPERGSYFSFPTHDEMIKFKKLGRRWR
jgi:methionyl-tRNA formyltransferase